MFRFCTHDEQHASILLDGTAASQESHDHDDDATRDEEVSSAQEGDWGEDGGIVIQLHIDIDANRQDDDTSNL